MSANIWGGETKKGWTQGSIRMVIERRTCLEFREWVVDQFILKMLIEKYGFAELKLLSLSAKDEQEKATVQTYICSFSAPTADKLENFVRVESPKLSQIFQNKFKGTAEIETYFRISLPTLSITPRSNDSKSSSRLLPLPTASVSSTTQSHSRNRVLRGNDNLNPSLSGIEPGNDSPHSVRTVPHIMNGQPLRWRAGCVFEPSSNTKSARRGSTRRTRQFRPRSIDSFNSLSLSPTTRRFRAAIDWKAKAIAFQQELEEKCTKLKMKDEGVREILEELSGRLKENQERLRALMTCSDQYDVMVGPLMKKNRLMRFEPRWARLDCYGMVYAKKESMIRSLSMQDMEKLSKNKMKKELEGAVFIPISAILQLDHNPQRKAHQFKMLVQMRQKKKEEKTGTTAENLPQKSPPALSQKKEETEAKTTDVNAEDVIETTPRSATTAATVVNSMCGVKGSNGSTISDVRAETSTDATRRFVFQTRKKSDPFFDQATRWVSLMRKLMSKHKKRIQATLHADGQDKQETKNRLNSRPRAFSKSYTRHDALRAFKRRAARHRDHRDQKSTWSYNSMTDEDSATTDAEVTLNERLRSLPVKCDLVLKRSRFKRWEKRYLLVCDHKIYYSKTRKQLDKIVQTHVPLSARFNMSVSKAVKKDEKKNLDKESFSNEVVKISMSDVKSISHDGGETNNRFSLALQKEKGGSRTLRFQCPGGERECLYWIRTLNKHYFSFRSFRRLTAGMAMDDAEAVPIKWAARTWNVNAKKPPDNLEVWLAAPDPKPHVYCIALQEVTKLTTRAVTENADPSFEWRKSLDVCLLPRGYTKVISQHLVGLVLIIYAQERIVGHISDIATKTVSAGVLGMAGNKGAVAVEFKIFQTKFSVVNCHLAAHHGHVKQRNQNLTKIFRRLQLETKGPADDSETDVVILLGDLNYRIAINDKSIVEQIIEKKDWPLLLRNDQLIKEKAAGHILWEYEEAEILFQPTFKFEIGTNSYEHKKGRIPSWCDRILWKSKIKNNITCYRYTSEMKYKISDHKPVCADLTIDAWASDRNPDVLDLCRQLTLDLMLSNNAKPVSIRRSSRSPEVADGSISAAESDASIYRYGRRIGSPLPSSPRSIQPSSPITRLKNPTGGIDRPQSDSTDTKSTREFNKFIRGVPTSSISSDGYPTLSGTGGNGSPEQGLVRKKVSPSRRNYGDGEMSSSSIPLSLRRKNPLSRTPKWNRSMSIISDSEEIMRRRAKNGRRIHRSDFSRPASSHGGDIRSRRTRMMNFLRQKTTGKAGEEIKVFSHGSNNSYVSNGMQSD